MDPVDFGHAMADALSEPGDGPEELATPTTESVIVAMLTENTGRHLLDSGGAYGRQWERNIGRDFAEEPEAYLDGVALEDRGDCWPMLSLYHYLAQRVEYDEEADRDFHAFAMSEDWAREPWQECLAAWAEARGYAIASRDNTYNGETFLDQDFQWVALVSEEEKNEEAYLFDPQTLFAIETHNGADIRGGYSAPRMFRTSLIALAFDADRATILCRTREPEQREQLLGHGPVQHVWDLEGSDTTESAIVDGHWEESRMTDDPLVNVRSLPDSWETVPTDPQGIIYRSDSAWHCPRCGAVLDVAAPFPSDG